ncbi:DUF2280 domain-containing protein [Acinetobacter baumannii]|uniref:DUF2280 domain-containing protein n=1 Tax=Acinetobacter baumannii TaxID=470 RepID=UPI000348E594|nr:DUF2280 domain-containing protein [Acinetobacter baumannii]EHU2509527.1 DUF2280 domain-containing protein [Acinetobacter baumannii]EHU2883074.1 DUF2280 domain-containing protein [Acinetobacter baumannii]EHU3108053.1 DUF2280 domain-containing protein [Acinetobacter baumannii]EHU3331514.1 DUF2280 domain-containing protein [Acinetobacter baumannii]EHU3344681.1 DUF2280 domain-containing protein [Acinetobacter baumannii]
MAALKEPVKIFIVQSLACRDTPQEVVENVKQEFDVEISRSQCQAYDPTKYSGRNLSQKYVELFESTREKFDEGLIDIPIANKYYRLKQYQRQLDRTRNVKTALKILEQAAKDIGGQFTNRQEITGKDGGPLQTVNSDVPVPMEEYLKARREVLDEY